MRALTGSDVLVEDKLFATLDTTVRTLTPPSSPPILIAEMCIRDRLKAALEAAYRAGHAAAEEER